MRTVREGEQSNKHRHRRARSACILHHMYYYTKDDEDEDPRRLPSAGTGLRWDGSPTPSCYIQTWGDGADGAPRTRIAFADERAKGKRDMRSAMGDRVSAAFRFRLGTAKPRGGARGRFGTQSGRGIPLPGVAASPLLPRSFPKDRLRGGRKQGNRPPFLSCSEFVGSRRGGAGDR